MNTSLRDLIESAADNNGNAEKPDSLVNLLALSDEELGEYPEHIELSQNDWQQIKQFDEHARRAARSDLFDLLADREGSLNSMLKKLSPNAQMAIRIQRRAADGFRETGGRKHLFDEKKELSLDHDPLAKKIIERFMAEEHTADLCERMNTPTRLDDSEPTLREIIEIFAGDDHG